MDIQRIKDLSEEIIEELGEGFAAGILVDPDTGGIMGLFIAPEKEVQNLRMKNNNTNLN